MREFLDLTPSPRLLEILGDIPYQPWQCLAEMVDNCFDAFLAAKAGADTDTERPTVWIDVPKAADAIDAEASVRVADNGPGMNEETLERSLRAGYSGNPRHGALGLFGMGFNIATARLGRRVEVKTTQKDSDHWAIVEIDFRDLQTRGTFQAPLRYEHKGDKSISGTEILVTNLNQEMRTAFRRQQQISSLKRQLGKVYSYLLRDEQVPGLADQKLHGRGYVLKLNTQVVRGRLPCVWSSGRSVTVRGVEIPAVIIIEHPLSTAFACQNCGEWFSHSVDECPECESDDVEPRERRIHGWIGIQRYLHNSDYGVDFLRNGRKILLDDKSIFTWDDPAGLSSITEYPIEVPANQGRIVGEIHLDHAGVTYQKNDFSRDTREWIDAIRLIRGDGPIQPQKARELQYETNESPLARLFSGFRRNDAGLRSLIPGDGYTALHEKARQWAISFHNGQQEYKTDTIWFNAAEEHDRIRNAPPPAPGGGDGTGVGVRDRMGLDEDPAGPHNSGLGDSDETSDDSTHPPIEETEQQRFDRYRQNASVLPGIDGAISIGKHARKEVATYLTSVELVDIDGKSVPSIAHQIRGGDLEIFVAQHHPVFAEYGRDPRDFAIIEIADALRTISSGDLQVSAATAEVLQQFPDQRFTDSNIRERGEAALGTIRALMLRIDAPKTDFWVSLSSTCKEAAEARAAAASPDLDWSQATQNGSFIEYLDGTSIAELIRDRPTEFFDGNVFRNKYGTWSSEGARRRVAERTARLVDTVAEHLADPTPATHGALRLMQVALDNLNADLESKA